MQEGEKQDQPGQVVSPASTAVTATVSQQAVEPSLYSPLTPVAAEPSPYQLPTTAPQASRDGVEWSASEYIATAKTAGWFALLLLGTIATSVVVYFVTRSVLSAVAIAIFGILLGVLAARQPHVLNYRVDQRGLEIGGKFYPYGAFKSFSVATEHAISYISLLPLRRFMPPLAIHYSPEDEDMIVDTLADHLPYEEHKSDLIDGLTRRARF